MLCAPRRRLATLAPRLEIHRRQFGVVLAGIEAAEIVGAVVCDLLRAKDADQEAVAL